MDDYSYEPVLQPNARAQRITRLLLLFWGFLGLVLVALLCYIVSSAFRPAPVAPQFVGDIDKYPPASINKEFINATFFDDTANQQVDTLGLDVVRDANGNFTVFFARSTRHDEAILAPRTCLVDWDDSLQKFLELCGGSQWNRDGTYVAGPAPRNLDRFPSHVENQKLYIDLKLIQGAAHP